MKILSQGELKRSFSGFEEPKLSVADRWRAFLVSARPRFRKWDFLRKRKVIYTDNPPEFVSALGHLVQHQFLIGRERVIVVVGGLRGAGKSTFVSSLSAMLPPTIKPFTGQGERQIAIMDLDSYFNKPSGRMAAGGWDNPRNSGLKEAARVIKDFARGRKTTFLTGRVSGPSPLGRRELDPNQSNLLVVEGIHSLNPIISKHAHVRCMMYIPPGLQEIRTWMRDLLKPKAKQVQAEHYLGMNVRVRALHRQFILPRIKDVDIFYQQAMSNNDFEAIARMLNLGPEDQKEFRAAWKVPLPEPRLREYDIDELR